MMICCPLQTHVRIISIISLILTVLSALNILKLIITGDVSDVLNVFFRENFTLALIFQFLAFIVHFITYVMSFMASFTKNKLMLIPFILVSLIHILFLVALVMYTIYLGSVGTQQIVNLTNSQNVFSGLGILTFIFILPISIAIAVSTFSLVVIVKFYHAIEAGRVDAMEPPSIIIQHPTPIQPLTPAYPEKESHCYNVEDENKTKEVLH